MTPKEKAKKLVKQFMSIDSDSEMFDGFKMGFFYAQRCALIAIDETISVIDPETNYKTWEFWKQVKHEIQQL